MLVDRQPNREKRAMVSRSVTLIKQDVFQIYCQ